MRYILNLLDSHISPCGIKLQPTRGFARVTTSEQAKKGASVATEFNLPGSSFEEIQKIVKGYSHAPEQASLDALARLTGLHVTTISRNNKFLTDVGLIIGGMKKNATELGRKLGRALDHSQTQDVQNYWKEAVQTNEKVSGLVTTVRIKGGMTEKELSNHILYVSGQKNTSNNRIGARCVVDILLAANLLQEDNGRLTVSAAPAKEILADAKAVADAPEFSSANKEAKDAAARVGDTQLSSIPALSSLAPQIAINIQLHLPETENAEVYEKLFKALRENLLRSAD
jgi:hypothetical protein